MYEPKRNLFNYKDLPIVLTKDELMSLVDLAIDLRQEDWFYELTERLREMG